MATALMAGLGSSAEAANFTWDGGSNFWDAGTTAWWNTGNVWVDSNDNIAIFGGTAGTVTLQAALPTAGGLTFTTTGYNLTAGTLTLAAPTGTNTSAITISGLGTRTTIGSVIAGTSGFTKLGAGNLVLTNANTISGDVAIKDGAIVITNANQLGTGTTAIGVTGISNSGNPGFGGGSLVLAGNAGAITLAREVSVSGRGPTVVNNTGGVVSIGYNTLSGGLTIGAGLTESRAASVYGTTTISGGVDLGAGNNVILQGNGNWTISGRVTGNDTTADRFQKGGLTIGSTLWLQNNTNNFAQGLLVSSGTVRVSDNGALGINGGVAALDLSNGTLEVRSDTNNGFSTRSIQFANNTTNTIVADHLTTGTLNLGSLANFQNQTVTFGGINLVPTAGNATNLNFNGRNGSNITILAVTGSGDGSPNFSNNGSGTLTLTGNVVAINSGTARTLTLQGGGETVVTGGFTPSGTGAHVFAKAGSGTLTFTQGTTGTASTFLGNTNLNDGTLAIRTINSLNPTSTGAGRVVFSNGALSFLGDTTTGAGETWTNKILDMGVASSYLLANQSGSAPTALILPNNWAAGSTAATKTLFLGGSSASSINNDISGLITNGKGATSVQKFGTNTWQLDAPTSYGSANASFGITAVGTTSSATITTTSTAGLVVGQPVSGTGVPAGAVISQILSATQFILSQNAVSTGTSVALGVASGATATLTNTTASGTGANPVITVASTANLVPGQRVTSTNLPASQNWYIRDITSTTTFTLANGTGANAPAIPISEVLTPVISPNFGGNLIITNGTVRANAGVAAADIINTSSNIQFANDSVTLLGNAGGTFEYRGSATAGALTEAVGSLVLSAGNGTVKITPNGGTPTLNFFGYSSRTAGATVNFQPATVGGIQFANVPTSVSSGALSGAYITNPTTSAIDFVATPLANTNIAALGAPQGALPATVGGAANNYSVGANFSTTGTVAANTIRVTGASTLTLGGTLTMTSTSGNVEGGILFDNTGAVAGKIQGAFNINPSTAGQDLLFIVGGPGGTGAATGLQIGDATGGLTTLGNGTAASVTKAGAGTLILLGGNTYTGNTTINEGTIQLSGTSAALGTVTTAGNVTTVRQGASLDINAAGTAAALYTGGTTYPVINVGALSGAGTITNSGGGASTQATINLGNSTNVNTGTTTFSGLLQDGAGILNVTVNGTTARSQAIIGAQPYTGVTTINTGNLVVTALADGASGLGNSATGVAGNLIFNGGTLVYTGAVTTGATGGGGIYQTTQTPSVTTNRLFSLAGNATILSQGSYGNESAVTGSGQNNASLVFGNTGDVGFLTAGAKTLTLGGNSIGDNVFRPRITDNGVGTGGATSFVASGGLWILNPAVANTYTGTTSVTGGQLRAVDGVGIPAVSGITLNGGVLEVAGSSTFTRTLAAGASNIQITGGASGFANPDPTRLVVTLGGGAVTWGGATFNPSSFVLSSTTALGETEFTNNIALGNAARTITVNNNGNTGAMVTAGILSGVISNGAGTAAGSITKSGGGVLILKGANTYTGNTTATNGNLIVTSIDTGAGASSLGAGGTLIYQYGDSDANALTYVGNGETANRNLQFTASATHTTNRNYRIESSGSGALVWNTGTFTASGISENATGRSIVMDLRGYNTDYNQMNLVLSNPTGGTNTPTLALAKNDGGVWILNPSAANTFTGSITSSGGQLGLTVNGVGTASSVIVNNGAIFGFGGALNLPTQLVQGTNSTGIFTGTNNITLGNFAKQAGTTDWTVSNNLENGAILTLSGTVNNLETTTTARTINFRGMGSTVLSGVAQNTAGSPLNISIAIDNAASFTMSGTSGNTYTGATTLSQGTLNLNKTAGVAQLGAGAATFNFNGGVVQAGSALTGANGLANLVVLGGDPATFSGANDIDLIGGLTNSGGTRLLVNNLANLTISTGAVNLSNDTTARTLTVLGSGTTTINSVIQNTAGVPTNAGGLTYSGTGSLVLTGVNVATGALTANRSTITLNGTGTWGGSVAMNPTGTVTLDNTGGSVDRLAAAGAVNGNGGTLNFIGEAAGGTTESAGVLTVNNTVSTIAMNVTGGTNTLNFTSFATPQSGSALDLSGIANLGATGAGANQVIFTGTAPTLTGGINTRIFVNGGADFATHGATGVIAFTGYNNSNNLNTAAATDTMNLTASAATTSNRTINALKLNGTGLSVSGAASNRLTLTAAGIVNTGGNNSLDITDTVFGATAVIQVAPGTTLTVNGDLSGGAGLSKALGGSLVFGAGARSFISSTHNLNGGTVTLNGGVDTLFPNQGFNVFTGSTLNLNGGSQYINSLNSQSAFPGGGGSINGGGLIVIGGGGGTFGGVISGATVLNRVGGGTLTLETAQTYTGTTLLMSNLTLENDATLANGTTPAIGINNAVLNLSNNSGLQTQNNDRIGDAIPLNLKGGTVQVTGRVSTAATETFGALNLLEGSNTINPATGGGTITSLDLTFASLSRAANQGTTLNFTNSAIGQQGNNVRVFFTSAPATILNGALGPWAIGNTTDFAAYNTGTGVGIVGQGGYVGYKADFASGNITEIPASANTTLNLTSGLTTTGMLKLSGAFTNDITFAADTNVLQLENGGLLRSNNANNTTIGVVSPGNRGILTAGTAAGTGVTDLYIYNNQGTTTINSVIADTSTAVGGTGTVRLVKSAAGTLALSAANTYSGGTIVNSPLQLTSPGTGGIATNVVIPAGGLTINNGTVTMVTNSGQINAANVPLLRGGSTLTLVGNNTLAGISFDNNGGTATPTVTTGGTLTLTNANPITVTSSNVGTVATLAGTVFLPTGSQTILIDPIQVAGMTTSNLTPTLNITAALLSPSTSLVKTGAGALQLSGQSTFNGLTVSNGSVILGAGSTNSSSVLVSGPLGVGSVSMASGTSLLTTGTNAVNNPVSFAGTPTFDSTATGAVTLSLNGPLTGAGLGGGTPTVEVTHSGLTVALLGTLPAASSYTKTGAGTLIFNATNYTGNFDASALGNPSAVSLIHDGNGTGSVQTIAMGSVNFDPGIIGTITVNRGGGTLPFPQAVNKILAPSSISTVNLGLTVANNNGYGLQVSDAIAFANTPTYTVNNATVSNVTQGLYLVGDLTGVAGTSGAAFNKAGAGTLVIANPTPANNTFTGNINIVNGLLSVANDNQLGTGTNVIQLNPGPATTGLTAGFRATGSFTLGHPLQLTNASTGNNRTIEVTNGNTLTLTSAFDLNAGAGATASINKADAGTLAINVSNTGWSGATTITQGVIQMQNSTALGTSTISVVPAAQVLGAALQLSGGITVANPINLQGNNNVPLGGINTGGQLQSVSGTNFYTGPITVGFDAMIGADTGSTFVLQAPITIGNQTSGRQFNFMAAGDIVLASGTGFTGVTFGISKFGAGTLNIQVPISNTTGSAGIAVKSGTLTLSNTGTTNATSGNLVQSGAKLQLDNSGTNTNNRLGGKAVTLQGGTFELIANNTTETTGNLTSDQGANTINNAGSGTSALTMGTLTQNAGSSLNIIGTFGTATNFVKFSGTGPALTPAGTGILNRVTVNGSDLATYTAGNGIVAFTNYAPAMNILGVGTTQTYKATPATLNSLTGNQTINALTLDAGATTATIGGLGGNPPSALTLTSGTILAMSSGAGTSTNLNVPIVAFAGNEGIIHVQAGQTLNVLSGMSGTAGMSKDLGGTLSLNAQQFVSGTTYVNGGTLKLNAGVTNTLLFNNGVAVNTGGTLDLNGQNQFIAGLSSASAGSGAGLAGGTVTNTAGGQSTFTVNSNTNFAGVISGNIYLNKTGTGALNLQAAQTYTGPTFISGGTVTLADYASLLTTSAIDINGGILSLGNGNLTDLANRVGDAVPITLKSGVLTMNGRQQGISSETLGAITIADGHNQFTTFTGGTNVNSLDVTAASLSRTGPTSTLRFSATGTIGSTARLMFTTAPTLTNNIIGPWAIVDRDYASYDSTYGIGGLNANGFAGYSGNSIAAASGTDNVRFGNAGTTTLFANATVGTLTFAQQTTATTLNLNGNTLTVQGGGVLFGQGTDSVNFSIANGSLTGPAGGGDLYLTHANFSGTSRTVSIDANIVNNGGAVRVIKTSGDSGASVMTFNGTNSYTGGTIINQGTLVLGATGTLGSGGLTVNQATFTQTAGGIIPAQALTLGGGSTVTLAGANSFTGLTISNMGGGAPTLTPTGTTTLTGGITVSTMNAGGVATIGAGNLDLNGAGSYSINVGATVVNGVDVAPWQAGLNITSTIQNGGIVKTGAGLLQLGGASTFTGGVDITSGGLVIASDTNSLVLLDPVTTGPVGTGTLTLSGASTTLVASGGTRTITNDVVITGDTVFAGTNSLNLFGNTTLPSIWGANVVAPGVVVTVGNVIGSVGTDVVNKSGLGTLSLGNYNGTINIAGGLILTADGNTLSTVESLNLASALNITADTAITVTRSGGAPNSRNKIIQETSLADNGSIVAVNNQNGYGLEITGATTFSAASHISVANATASNVVQGVTLSGVVSDSGGFSFVKSGAGTLALTNAGNTFGGAGQMIDVLNGVLSVNSDGALGNAANTIILEVDGTTGTGFRSTGTFSTARTFNLNAVNNAFEVTAGNVLTLTTPFVLSAATNTLTKNDNGVLEIAASNAGWTGAITINAGAIRVSDSNAIGSGTLTVNNAVGSALQLSGGVNYASPITLFSNGASGFNSAGVIQSVSGSNTISGLISQTSGSAVTIGADAGATLNINGAIATTNSTTFNAGAGGTINLNSLLGNGGTAGPNLTKNGPGTLVVTVNQPAITSTVNVNQGTLTVVGSGVTLGTTGTINIGTGATLNVDDSSGAASTHLGNRPMIISGGTFSYTGNGANSTETSTGALTLNRGGTVFSQNQTGPGTISLTLANLTIGTDNSAAFTGANLGTPTNKLLFTTAANLTNGIISRATVNGSTFATYGANGIAGYTAYNAAANINSPASTDTVDVTAAMTTTALTATKTINAIRFSNAAGTNVGGAAFNQLVLGAGSALATGGGTNTLSVPVLNNAAVQNIFLINSGTTLNVASTVVGTAGTVKDGDGTLILSSPVANTGAMTGVNANTVTGTVNLSRGTLTLAGGTNTLTPGVALVMGGPSATLNLNGTSQVVGAFLTDSGIPNTGGSVIGGAGSQLVINLSAADRSFSGSIGGSVNLVRSGPNTITFFSPNTTTGTTLINGGTTILSGDGSLSATTALDINYATLSADNSGFSDNGNRINDAAPITLRAGTLTVQGRAQAASTEALGTVSVNQGFNVINPLVGGTGINSVDVSLASLSRPAGSAATLIVQGTALGTIGSASRVTVGTLNGVATLNPTYSRNGSGLTENLVGGWAENGNDFLTYIPGLGLAPLNQVGAPQYDLTNTFTGAGSTDNIRLTATTNLLSSKTVNAVSMTGSAINITFTNATDSLNITSGGLIGPNNNNSIGAATDSGRLTAGGLTPGANSDLYVFNRANTLTINSRIIDNPNGGTSAVRAVFTASGGTIALNNPNNSYTGGTVVNGGTLTLNNTAAGAIIPAGGVTINGGTVTMNNFAGQIAAANVVTLNGNSTLNLFGNNTLAGLVFNNLGSSGTAAVNTFVAPTATVLTGSNGVLTIGASGIVATSVNVNTTPVIQGRIDLGASLNTIQVDPININGVDVAPLQAALAIQGIEGSAGGFNKTGNGVLQFNAMDVYTGPTNVTAGGIRTGVTNGGSRYSDLTLNAGTTLNLNGATTLWGSLAGSGTVFNSSTSAATLIVGFNNNASTTFSGQLTRFNDAVVNGVAIQKVGTGELVMDSAQAFATGTTGAITVNGGSIKYRGVGEAFNGTAASGGGSFTLNTGGTIALDNAFGANVNSRLGLDVAGTLAIQGGKLTVNGNSGTSTTETITTFNVTNGGGRVELTPDAGQPLTLAIGALSTANGNGSLVIGGITGAASAAGVANVTITTANLIGGQGGAANGALTMSVRHDILADPSATGLGTGFLVKDSVTNNYRALGAAGELSSTFALPLTTDVDPITAGNQAAGTLNVGLAGSTQALPINSVANTLTMSGTTNVNGLGATFGNYGPAGGLLSLTLSNAAASLTTSGTANINTGAFGSTSAGTTIYAHVLSGATLNVNGYFGVLNTGGLAKADGGLMSLNQPAFYTGTTTINAGTLKLASGQANTIAVIPGATTPSTQSVTLNGTTAILDLNGLNQAVNALASTNPLPGQGGTVTSSTAANLTSTGGGTFAGNIGGSLSFTRSGNNTTLLTGVNSYTGATVVRGGVLQLRDSGSILNTPSISVQYGTLQIDQSNLNPNGTPNPTRISATTPVTLQGAGLTLTPSQSADSSATINTVSLTGGATTITPTVTANTGTTNTLTIGNLQTTALINAGGTLNIAAAAGQVGINQARLILNQVNGVAPANNSVFGPNIIANSGDYAGYVTAQGIGALGSTGFPAYGAALASAANTPTVINNNTAALAIGANTTTGSLKFGTNATTALTFTGGTEVLNLALGGLLSANNNNAVNIGTSALRGVLTTGGTATTGTVSLVTYQNQGTTTIESIIANNGLGATTRLVKSGVATLTLTAPNTFTGGTIVDQGTLNLTATTAGNVVIPAGPALNLGTGVAGLVITNGTVTQNTNAQQIATTADVLINGTGTLNLTVGANTLNSVNFVTTGGTGNPTVAVGAGLLTLAGATPITATNDSFSITPVISGAGGLTFSNAAPQINVAGLSPESLQISAVISGANPISKVGTGGLSLTAANTFTGGLTVNNGSVIFGNNAAAGAATGALTINNTGTGVSVLSDGTIRTLANPTTVQTDFTFGGVTAGNGLILSGAMGLGAVSRTLTVSSPAVTSTISGAITSTATSGAALTKAGPGTLVLSNAGNNFAGLNVAVTGGILKNGIANAIPAASGVDISAGAGYDLNNLDQTVDRISGTGFITQSGGSAKTLTVSSTANNSTFAGILTDNVLGSAASRLALTKVGTATTLTLTNANTYSGVTTVTSGIVSISNGSGLGTTTGGTTVSAGGSLELQGSIAVGAEALTINGTGSATNGALRNLSGANTYGGTVTLGSASTIQSDAGSLTLNAANAIAAGTNALTVTGAANTTVSGTITGTTATLDKTGAGTLTLNGTGANTFTGKTTVTAGMLDLNKSGGANAIAGPASGSKVTENVLINGGTLRLLANDQIGNNAYVKITSGTFNLNGKADTIFHMTNSGGAYTSGRGGALTVTDPIWSGGTNDVFGNDSYGTLEISGGTNTIHGDEGTSLGAGSITVGTGGLTFSAASSLTVSADHNNSISHPTYNGLPGTLTLATGANVTVSHVGGTSNIVSGPALQSDGVTPVVDQTDITKGVLALGATQHTVTVTDAAATLAVSTVVTGAGGGITTAGAGKVTLSATNTYTGPTNVTGTSTLEISGSINATTSVSVTGGTLLLTGGSERVNDGASVTLSGGTLAFDNSLNNVTETLGNLTLNANSFLDFGTGGGAGGNNTFQFGSTFTTNGFTLSVYNWSGSTYDFPPQDDTNPTQDRLLFGTTAGTVSAGDAAMINFYSDNGVTLLGSGAQINFGGFPSEIVPVPEPSSTALLGAAGLLALVGYRERRRLGGVLGRKSKQS